MIRKAVSLKKYFPLDKGFYIFSFVDDSLYYIENEHKYRNPFPVKLMIFVLAGLFIVRYPAIENFYYSISNIWVNILFSVLGIVIGVLIGTKELKGKDQNLFEELHGGLKLKLYPEKYNSIYYQCLKRAKGFIIGDILCLLVTGISFFMFIIHSKLFFLFGEIVFLLVIYYIYCGDEDNYNVVRALKRIKHLSEQEGGSGL